MISVTPAEYVPGGRSLCRPDRINGGTVALALSGDVAPALEPEASAASARPNTIVVMSNPPLRPIRNCTARHNINNIPERAALRTRLYADTLAQAEVGVKQMRKRLSLSMLHCRTTGRLC